MDFVFEEEIGLDIAQKFVELKDVLKDLIAGITENNDVSITSLTFQLKKINSTINELKKNSIAVPDQLITLKLSLSSQIDKIKDSEKMRKELIQCLELNALQLKEIAPEKPVRKEKIKKITVQERVELIDLINASVVPANVEFYAYYKNTRLSATLLPNGSLEMMDKKKKKIYQNHRAAATAITGYKVDPWNFWKLDFEGKPLTLDDYRSRYFKKKQKEENKDPKENVEINEELA